MQNESRATGEKIPETALKAIRLHCLSCSCGSAKEVRECELKHCNLYRYRLGKNPARKGRPMTDEQRAKAAARLMMAREKKEVANG